MAKTVFITGTSSGLGKLTATHFAKHGWNVAATMRNPERETELTQYDNIKLFKLDVTNVAHVQAAVQGAIEAFGNIDVVVNNAGMGAYGPLELAEEETIDWQFAVNVRGPINVIRGFLPHFRQKREGLFINISSVMGLTTLMPGGSLYNMSKFALEGLTEALYYELKPLNIELRLIEQGGSTGNNFVNGIIWNEKNITSDYDDTIHKMKEKMGNAPAELMDDPQVIVDAIYRLATRESNQFRTLVGPLSKMVMDMRNSMPVEEYLAKMAG